MKKNIQYKNAIDFLLFSYFGIAIDGDFTKEKIIEVAIQNAYTDATNQGAYNAILDSDYKCESQTTKEKCIKMIKIFIDKVLEIPSEYDIRHNELCTDIVNNYKGIKSTKEEAAFTYGNAQKWVNMTMKNLYVICGVCSEEKTEDFCTKVNEASKYFHIPVDSFIIEKLWGEEGICLPYLGPKNEKGLPIYSRKTFKNDAEYKKGDEIKEYTESRVKSWSLWDEKEYDDFRNSLNKYFENKDELKIDWEGPAWIEIAKSRKQIKEKLL